MQMLRYLCAAAALLAAGSCTNPAPSAAKTEPDQTTATTTTETQPAPRTSHNCAPAGKMLDENAAVWIRSREVLVAITADSSTYDPDYGDSYRVAEVYDTRDCSLIERKVLPVNVSPDFPYYVAEISYNNVHQMAAIRGFRSIYLYDAENKRWLPEFKPKYISARSGGDAQSGMIQRLEVWEDYLIGYAQDYGAFVFDLGNKNQPAPVMPFAEFKSSPVDYQSVFMLPVEEGKYQAIAPGYDAEKGTLNANPLFNAPMPLKLEVQKSAANNRFLVLRQNDAANTAVAIDVSKRRLVNLPQDIATKPTQDILAWMRNNS